MDLSKRTIQIQKTFNAPINLVWETWTNPDYIQKWWSPKGMETTIVTFEFSEGGIWKYAMGMSNGMEFLAEGKFKEIVASRKIISEANFKPKTEGVVIESFFENDGDTTHFKFQVVHPTEKYKDEQVKMGVRKGWEAAFERLADLLWELS